MGFLSKLYPIIIDYNNIFISKR